MLIVKNLTLKTREIILTDGNMILNTNKIYGLTAPNGSGKTTLLRVLVGLKSSQKGSVYIQDENGAKLSLEQARKKIFYVESSTWLNRNLSGMDYLKFINTIWKSNIDITEIIKFWKTQEYINIPIKKCSLGMKQKILLSMYAASDADYWILDEPTNGLDEQNILLFKKFILQAKNKGKTILFSSHQSDNIYTLCDSIFYIENKHIKSESNAKLMEEEI